MIRDLAFHLEDLMTIECTPSSIMITSAWYIILDFMPENLLNKYGFDCIMVHLTLTKILKADRPHPRDYSKHRQTPWTDNDSSLLFATLGKAEL